MDLAPDDECGTLLIADHLLVRNEKAAFALRSAIAYTHGLTITISIHTRTPLGDGWDPALFGTDPQGIRIAYGYTPLDLEHTLAAPHQPVSDTTTLRHIVRGHGGDGDHGTYEITAWVSTAHTTEEFDITTIWPRMDIEQTTTTITVPPQDELNRTIIKLWP